MIGNRLRHRTVLLGVIILVMTVSMGSALAEPAAGQTQENGNTDNMSDSTASNNSDPSNISKTDGEDTREGNTSQNGMMRMSAVTDSISAAEPNLTTEATINDSEMEKRGITVKFDAGTGTVSEVILYDTDLRGNVMIKEYINPPSDVKKVVAESIANNIVMKESDDDQTVNIDLFTIANITVLDGEGEEVNNTPANISLQVNESELDDPEKTVAGRVTNGSWEELETTIEPTTNETVTVTAQTDGFSVFAVGEVETVDEESSENDTQDSMSTTNSPDSTDDSSFGFSLSTAFIALATVMLLIRWPSR